MKNCPDCRVVPPVAAAFDTNLFEGARWLAAFTLGVHGPDTLNDSLLV